MEPRVIIAPGARQRLVGASADETKYDGRNVHSTLRSLQRLACGALVLVALAMLAGDGAILRSRLRAAARPAAAPAVPGAHGVSGGALFVEQAGDGAGAYGGEAPEPEAAEGAAAAAEEDDPAVAWGGAGGKPQHVEPDSHVEGVADPALAEFASEARREALANKLLDAEAHRALVPDDAPIGKRGAAAGGAGGGGGGKARSLNEMADPPADWALNAAVTGCEGYFGNGFTEQTVLLGGGGGVGGDAAEADDGGAGVGHAVAAAAPAASGPRLVCRQHPSTHAHYCTARDVVLHPARLTMSRGGEELDQVMGRGEDIELPSFEAGALEFYEGDVAALSRHSDAVAAGGAEVPEGGPAVLVKDLTAFPGASAAFDRMEPNDPYKARMFRKARVLEPAPEAAAAGAAAAPLCHTVVSEPVVFVTRVEYANLFHTSTDWWNVWQTARIAGLAPTADYSEDALRGLTTDAARLEAASPRRRTPRIPVHVIFMDGHNASPMDDGWGGLVLSFNYAKHFDGPTCFTNVLFAPYGYHAAISQGMGTMGHQCAGAAHIRQFGHDMLLGLGLTPRARATCGSSSGVAGDDSTAVVFVRRVHYKAHPRHDGKIVRRLDNEDEIYTALEAAAPAAHVRLLNGLFSSMSVTEQVAMVQEACVVVGAHGAGLSHILFAPDGAHMLELQPPSFQRPHFIAYTHWAGSTHHVWALGTSQPAPADVVARVRELVAQTAPGGGGGGGGAAGAAAAPGLAHNG